MKRIAMIVLASAVLAAGCGSPEATRTRGGGPGADVGNRGAVVKMHEGSQQYWDTPVEIYGHGPPLGPSEQARQLSLPGRRQQGSSPEPSQMPSNGGRGQ